MVQYCMEIHAEKMQSVWSHLNEKKKLRCVCKYSRAHVAKVRNIRKGTGYQQVSLSIHGKSGTKMTSEAHNLLNQNQGQGSRDSHWMFLLCRLGDSYRTSGEDISSCIQF